MSSKGSTLLARCRAGISRGTENPPQFPKGVAVSVARKIFLPVTTLFLALSAMFLAVGAAAGETGTCSGENDNDWHLVCP
jgi:hypothetical protein